MHRARIVRVCVFVITSVLTWLFLHDRASNVIEEKEEKLPGSRYPLGNFEPRGTIVDVQGPGEGGRPHFRKKHPEAVEYGMNLRVSEEISLERSLPDTRLSNCKYIQYPQNLPTASVIIVFENVGWSVLIRAVHSVINRTPTELLEEVLLVDDFSQAVNLQGLINNYLHQFGEKVIYIRLDEKTGLLAARNKAVKKATGNVIVFLDGYCEVNVNWLPPLLSPIYYNKTSITVPIIDSIDSDTFEYKSVRKPNEHYRGIFDWALTYREHKLPSYEAKKRKFETEPYKSPTHAGALLAISRDFFLTVGGYDEVLTNWGADNLDLSFKSWQCGRGILWVPCSRVGHIYNGAAQHLSYLKPLVKNTDGPPFFVNLKRVVETWLDPRYKKYFYTRIPFADTIFQGHIFRQLAQKRKLKCKSFDWFMKNVAYDVLDTYPELPENKYWGILINMETNECLAEDIVGKPGYLIAISCRFTRYDWFRFNKKGQLAFDDKCMEILENDVLVLPCSLGTTGGPWEYDNKTYTLYHRVLRKCVALHPDTKLAVPSSCNYTDYYQKWEFQIPLTLW